MSYEMETYRPYAASRSITADELPGLYVPDREPVFSYGCDEDGAMIVSLHDGFSTVSLLHDGTWYWLEESPDSDPVEILLCGQEAWVPAGVMVRRETGLAALLLTPDLPRLLAEFTWREQ
ncbi:hypothetical protein GCM10009678_70060 [Actinomadura kijaniata]|uniref:Uncharacterized protein n=1 Tax=Actinomadura namibiensis TaxID=182080 RepID=A0A7W3LSX2_ACTNM|nr:hypothetical protein [Actinomadura namibiensis]MBA8953693.1 hypothetical protein [Actinomadura namibiensis]